MLTGSTGLAMALGTAVVRLWRTTRRLTRDLERAMQSSGRPGLPRGASAPPFTLTRVGGDTSSLIELSDAGRPIVLVFLSTHCGPCIEMLPMLANWQQSLAESVVLAPIFSGDVRDIQRLSEEHALGATLAQDTDETFMAYNLRATPSGVMVGTDGAIASAPAEGAAAIEALLRSASHIGQDG
jgi:thiol-disulfide isomerase/thioredoxin